MLSVLTSPTRTFARLREPSDFAWPFLLLSLLLMIATSMQSGNGASSMLQWENGQLFWAYTQTLIGFAVRVLIVGGLLWFLNAMIQGEATYGQLCKVALFSLVPYVLIELIRGGYVLATGNLFLSNDHRVSLPPDEWSYWLNVLFSLGGFLWVFALTLIGTAVMSNRPRAAVVVWLVVGWFCVFPMLVVLVLMILA
jgi:hypothetical protein